LSEALLPSVPRDWKRAITEIATRTHALFLRHPWALVSMASAPPGRNAMLHMEQCLQALSQTKLTAEQKLTLLAMVDDFVFGSALRESAGDVSIDMEFITGQLATGAFPQLTDIFRNGRVDARTDRFEIGLRLLLDSHRSWLK
jgi:Tetracyclin repressor-like, C-terminal domain